MSDAVLDTNLFTELKDSMGADFIAELIDTYCEETPQLIQRLQEALAQGDANGFRLQAHSIKSSSAALGAVELAALARALEMLGKAGDLSAAGPEVERLTRAYGKAANALREKQHGA
jgi:HPt (histidine-containing phosphotransfer) domain-containing protein